MQPKAGPKHQYGCSIESPQTTSGVQMLRFLRHCTLSSICSEHSMLENVWFQSGYFASVQKMGCRSTKTNGSNAQRLCFGHGANLCPAKPVGPQTAFCGTPPEAHERPRRLHAAPDWGGYAPGDFLKWCHHPWCWSSSTGNHKNPQNPRSYDS